MNEKGLDRAEQHLADAQRAVESLAEAPSVANVVAHWSEFLSAAQRVYSKLAASADGPRSLPWFGRIKAERKRDPLLQYIHHARNADEHGIELVTQTDPGGIMIGGPYPSAVTGNYNPMPSDFAFGFVDGRPTFSCNGPLPPMVEVPAAAWLVPVVDSGRSYDPPEHHLNQAVDGTNPRAVAEAALGYLRSMLDDAKTYGPDE